MLNTGKRIHGFEIIRSREVSELNGVLYPTRPAAEAPGQASNPNAFRAGAGAPAEDPYRHDGVFNPSDEHRGRRADLPPLPHGSLQRAAGES